MLQLRQVIFFNLYNGYQLKFDPFRKQNKYTVLHTFGRVGGDCASFAEAVQQIRIHKKLSSEGLIR